jgi:malonate-semialdehyde dehydrogenase (acetylating)/methylmalonate-semialdehyde dehydrogenase
VTPDFDHNALHIGHFVGGRHVVPQGGANTPLFNPSTGAQTGLCALADRATVDDAVRQAAAAGRQWAQASQAARQRVIYRLRELVIAHTDRLAEVIGAENGKTLADARGEIGRTLESIEFATNAPHVTKGEYSRNVGGGVDTFSMREPLGVVAAIAPFNFPVMMPLFMATMAVACGNAVIHKASERVPRSALYLARLWQEAGLPDGVWSVVNGGKEAVNALLEHPLVPAISFVGSTRIGEYIYQHGCAHNKRVGAYTGGKNHMVVMPDADLDAAATAFVTAGYGSASQRCMAVSLLLPVGEGTAERLIERMRAKLADLKVGSYDDPVADYGPLVSAQARQTCLEAVDVALAAGATVVADGRGLQVPGRGEGYYLGPTLLDHVTPEMAFYQEEVFGPARGIVRAATLDEAIAITNAHEYGNGAVIFTRDGHSAQRFMTEVEAGMIGVNVPIPVPVGYFNFGGLRRSRFGDAQMFGPDAARFFTKLKTVSQRWPLPGDGQAPESASLAFVTNA